VTIAKRTATDHVVVLLRIAAGILALAHAWLWLNTPGPISHWLFNVPMNPAPVIVTKYAVATAWLALAVLAAAIAGGAAYTAWLLYLMSVDVHAANREERELFAAGPKCEFGDGRTATRVLRGESLHAVCAECWRIRDEKDLAALDAAPRRSVNA
jgi:hypothetical protein